MQDRKVAIENEIRNRLVKLSDEGFLQFEESDLKSK